MLSLSGNSSKINGYSLVGSGEYKTTEKISKKNVIKNQIKEQQETGWLRQAYYLRN